MTENESWANVDPHLPLHMAHIPAWNDNHELIQIRLPDHGHNSTLMTGMLYSRGEAGNDFKGPQKARSSPKVHREWAEKALFINLSRFRLLESITVILSFP